MELQAILQEKYSGPMMAAGYKRVTEWVDAA
jgi:hypothetical protein